MNKSDIELSVRKIEYLVDSSEKSISIHEISNTIDEIGKLYEPIKSFIAEQIKIAYEENDKSLINEIEKTEKKLEEISYMHALKMVNVSSKLLIDEIEAIKKDKTRYPRELTWNESSDLQKLTMIRYKVGALIRFIDGDGELLAKSEGIRRNIKEYEVIISNPPVEEDEEGCYIATMVYGDYEHNQVLELRYFRDNTLKRTSLGSLLILLYYKYSPSLVVLLKNKRMINSFIKFILDKTIATLKIIRY